MISKPRGFVYTMSNALDRRSKKKKKEKKKTKKEKKLREMTRKLLFLL